MLYTVKKEYMNAEYAPPNISLYTDALNYTSSEKIDWFMTSVLLVKTPDNFYGDF